MSFYKTHSVFFLVIGGVLFGFLRGEDHMALAALFVSSPYLVSIPMIMWMGYALMIVRANKACLAAPENEFMQALLLQNRQHKIGALFVTSWYQLLPVLAYGFFLIAMAVQQNNVITMGMLSIALPVLLIIVAITLRFEIRNMSQEKKQWALVRWMNRHISRPSTLFFIEWIFRKQWVIMFLVKAFSVLLLTGILLLYGTDTYDARLLGMGLALSAGIHTNVMYDLHCFNNVHFALLRNLPFSLWQRQRNLLVVWLILLLPELAFCIGYLPDQLTVAELIADLVYMVSVPVFYDGWLTRNTGERQYFTFYYVMLQIVLILFGVPALALTMLNMVGGSFLTYRHYYQFEALDNR